jgi:hypothetical protein
VTREVWLVEVRVLGTDWEPWLLVTDWPVIDAQSAIRIFKMYRQRWSVEDSFKCLKTCLGWEDLQVLDWQGIRTLVALAWVAAGFLFDLGVTLDWVEVQLLNASTLNVRNRSCKTSLKPDARPQEVEAHSANSRWKHIAKLGGWEPHKDRKPGKMTLLRGLGRLFEMLATQAMLSGYAVQPQGLPPRIAAFLHDWQPPGDL